ncbi:unnamed protein product (macronuclear) [Paramecium tetraurelia]|uniref:Uncharacterized protein n=1 Tax=Paramecium tetraurelia TaxID=5888 RepID=A0BR19_PARTE|nr:uncharacterized protein GSPATT00031215001 [Paramecium tetraurelia]CAK60986.1 unnamed protein product [Paramecium tetraurelia]|eukprot:XP_001428384.1 hypothetical protein (macronuclear) [Paramecium tetraurelia strain d4-2]
MEIEFIKDQKIVHYGMDEIIELDIGQLMTLILKQFEGKPIHLSFMSIQLIQSLLMGLEPWQTEGSNQGKFIKFAESRYLIDMDLVEINPQLEKTPELREEFLGIFNKYDIGRIQGTQRVALGIELIASALGRTLVL